MVTFPGKDWTPFQKVCFKSNHYQGTALAGSAIGCWWANIQAVQLSGQLQNPVSPKLGANKPRMREYFQISAGRVPAARRLKQQQVGVYKLLQVSDSTFLSHSSFKELLIGNCLSPCLGHTSVCCIYLVFVSEERHPVPPQFPSGAQNHHLLGPIVNGINLPCPNNHTKMVQQAPFLLRMYPLIWF